MNRSLWMYSMRRLRKVLSSLRNSDVPAGAKNNVHKKWTLNTIGLEQRTSLTWHRVRLEIWWDLCLCLPVERLPPRSNQIYPRYKMGSSEGATNYKWRTETTLQRHPRHWTPHRQTNMDLYWQNNQEPKHVHPKKTAGGMDTPRKTGHPQSSTKRHFLTTLRMVLSEMGKDGRFQEWFGIASDKASWEQTLTTYTRALAQWNGCHQRQPQMPRTQHPP